MKTRKSAKSVSNDQFDHTCKCVNHNEICKNNLKSHETSTKVTNFMKEKELFPHRGTHLCASCYTYGKDLLQSSTQNMEETGASASVDNTNKPNNIPRDNVNELINAIELNSCCKRSMRSTKYQRSVP